MPIKTAFAHEGGVVPSRYPTTSQKQRVETAIKAEVHETVQLVRRYSESQVESWRRVPLLALQADGRVGRYYTNSWLEAAYMHGLWRIPASFKNVEVFVDCDTGGIVGRQLEAVEDKYILAIASKLSDIDAGKVIDELSGNALQETAEESLEARLRRKWRQEIVIQEKIQERYVRTSPPKWIFKFV